ncbi:hypothetical protein DDB_G0274803 [Dictyostelium discoideum AX4]|uniref:Uncharacterized protein n=1 Tax=Dictyostelium discoideum TaxID=44689 RepID=Q555X3_DICDI|nr:hypothetical protein DDB_G0274803 [Dictyostelium discoideum AX4]EAL70294.1 hypothetical protein DDB_G0274803 [Dictyostelium discoideum AX4]|eukprot:XP_643937.1 hypothetical protein DDB_G0274803 [Dictyostelium discoideum AX4]
MEMNLTFTENRSIKILILPIGDISPEKYKEYTSLIKTINIIELSSITRSQNELSPFEKISWVDGSMILNFVDIGSFQRSEYEDLQTYKKVFGVIGVVDCKKSKDLQETKRLFEIAVAQYPSCVSSLCCAFDPMDDQPDLGLGANLIMIPNNSDRKHLIFYLTTLLIDFSHMILKYFEKMVYLSLEHDGTVSTLLSNQYNNINNNSSGIINSNSIGGNNNNNNSLIGNSTIGGAMNSGVLGSSVISNSNNNSLITTPLDSIKLWDEIGRAKKRKFGRLNKCRGDFCLLAGSPLDAIKYYDLSIDACRSNNDWEWLAGSCEGYISAVLLKRNQEFNTQAQSSTVRPINSPNSITGSNSNSNSGSYGNSNSGIVNTPSGGSNYNTNNTNSSSNNNNNNNNNSNNTNSTNNNLNNNNNNNNNGVNGMNGTMNILDLQIQSDDLKIRELASEAIISYNKRKVPQFEVDVMLKFANYHISMDRRIEASELLTNAYDFGMDLSFTDRITLSCSIALLYYSMGFRRKFAFYLREAAFLYNTRPENWEKINHLLIIASKYYQLEDLFSNSPSRFLDEGGSKKSHLSFTLNQMKKSNSVTSGRNNNNNGGGGGGGGGSNGNNSKNSSPTNVGFQAQYNQFNQSIQQQVQSNSSNRSSSSSSTSSRFTNNIPELSYRKPKFGWSVIQRYLIYNLISVSTNLMDSLNICKYIIHLLRTQYKKIAQQKQVEFQLDLLHHSKALSLSINTNVHMNLLGLPFIVKVSPIQLPNQLEPIVRPSQQSLFAQREKNSNNFFIYSPYGGGFSNGSGIGGGGIGGGGSGGDSNSNRKKVVWAQGEECSVVVTLSNPFSFDIFIQSLTLSTAGVPFESYPLSFKILSLTDSMDIVISGKPLESGPLIIKGVFVRAYNLLSEHPVDPYGNSISISQYNELVRIGDAYKVDILEFDSTTTASNNTSSFSRDNNNNNELPIVNKIKATPKLPILKADVPTLGKVLNLLAGESFSFNLEFQNIGTTQIDSISVSLNEFDKALKKKTLADNNQYFTDSDDETISFQWDSNIIKSSLPLLPGETFKLPIKSFSKPFLIGNQFIIDYYSNCENEEEEEEFNNTTTTTNTNTQTLTVTGNTQSTLTATTTTTATKYQRKITIPLPLSITHGPQVINFDIVYASSKIIKSLSPYLVDRSTSNNGLFKVEKDQDLIEKDCENIYNDYCLLLFDIKNCTSTHTFTISSELELGIPNIVDNNKEINNNLSSKFILSPNGIITIIVPMKRESLPDQLPPLRQAKGQYIKPKKKLTEYEEYVKCLIQYYKDLLTSKIKLLWNSSDNTNGSILLDNIVLTSKLIHKLNKDQVLIQFKNNKQLVKTIEQGGFETIEVLVTNLTNTPINGLVLHILPIIDQTNNNNNGNNKNNGNIVDVSNKLGYIGSLTTPIQELPVGATFNHSLDVIFFERESYKFIISCEIFKTKQIIPASHSLLVNVV